MRIQVPTNGQRIDTLPDTLSFTVEECPRCDSAHEGLVFSRFRRPPPSLGDTLYWASCPVTGEPVLGQLSAPPPTLHD